MAFSFTNPNTTPTVPTEIGRRYSVFMIQGAGSTAQIHGVNTDDSLITSVYPADGDFSNASSGMTCSGDGVARYTFTAHTPRVKFNNPVVGSLWHVTPFEP